MNWLFGTYLGTFLVLCKTSSTTAVHLLALPRFPVAVDNDLATVTAHIASWPNQRNEYNWMQIFQHLEKTKCYKPLQASPQKHRLHIWCDKHSKPIINADFAEKKKCNSRRAWPRTPKCLTVHIKTETCSYCLIHRNFLNFKTRSLLKTSTLQWQKKETAFTYLAFWRKGV